ncbi:GNAT family N-acetyltransferase [Chryseobacterium potabilaquae]|uniref:N-acetyltransferase domain-containing protein n=1 Tax=Chryseobacterium potabilaquae TaxID=2675057 RepID=A0A6N4X6N9_9FLAO|nr:GNAT family N-acetyltransferase [Chryseobacterium potabilaquae]CAA7194909.1 hypothetical protein CHRY9293_01169 [Chryseobacterium potabilaquae]
MITLRFFTPKDFPKLNYALDETQLKYTSTVEEALIRVNERNDSQLFPVTVFKYENQVGFFVLDFGEDKFDLTENKNAVLLRSLSINPLEQGKGIGKVAMAAIDNFMKEHFKDCDEIVLAVNQQNHIAYKLYTAVGYIYDGKSRMGRSGLQYLMYKRI